MHESQQLESQLLATLDDDCLRNIFKYLPLPDLCNAAEVCMHFKRHADERFQSSYSRSVEFYLWNEYDKDHIQFCDSQSTLLDLQLFEQLLQNFGKFVHIFKGSLPFVGSYLKESQTLMSLMNQYCAGTLKELDVRVFLLKGCYSISSLRPMFAGLEKLSMCCCTIDMATRNLLSFCSELKFLKFGFIYFDDCIDAILIKFPKLVELELTYFFHADHVDSFLDEIMRLNGNLEKLSLISTRVSSKVCIQIARRLPRLQSLLFNQNFIKGGENETEIRRNLLHLNEIRTLKELSINCNGFALSPVVDGFANSKLPLEYFGILHGTVDLKLLKSIAAFDSLTKLGFNRVNWAGVSLIDVAKHFPQLTELRIENITMGIIDVKKMLSFAQNLKVLRLHIYDDKAKEEDMRIDDESFKFILQMVKNRGNSTKLVIHIHKDYVKVSKNLMQQNRYWLEIKEQFKPFDFKVRELLWQR